MSDLKNIFVNVAVMCPVNVCITYILNRFVERGGIYILHTPMQTEVPGSILNPKGQRQAEISLLFIFQIGKSSLIDWIGEYDEKNIYAMDKFFK
jgi:hypothetical protein